jgi:hypothetical protein
MNDVLPLELDPPTAQLVERLAQNWGVTKQEAIRRALREAGKPQSDSDKERRLDALKSLQQSLHLTPAKAAEWQEAIRDARR